MRQELTEEQLYETLWKTEYTPSACATPLAIWAMKNVFKHQMILDVGCGDGTTVRLLREAGFSSFGVDITMTGIQKRTGEIKIPDIFTKASVTDLSIYPDSIFDVTISTDCLEHLPPKDVDKAICEILRVTKTKTFHSMPTWGDDRLGQDVHKSKHPMEWWRERFALFNTKGIEVKIQEREEFLEEMK